MLNKDVIDFFSPDGVVREKLIIERRFDIGLQNTYDLIARYGSTITGVLRWSTTPDEPMLIYISPVDLSSVIGHKEVKILFRLLPNAKYFEYWRTEE